MGGHAPQDVHTVISTKFNDLSSQHTRYGKLGMHSFDTFVEFLFPSLILNNRIDLSAVPNRNIQLLQWKTNVEPIARTENRKN